MSYLIQGRPIGLSAPRSAFETLHGIIITAKKVKRKIVVAKADLVAKLHEKGSMFAEFWNATNVDQIEFEEKSCKKVKT